MPGGDRTGPMGMGVMTGRRAGYCSGHSVSGYMNQTYGMVLGFAWSHGFRRDGGRRRRHWFQNPLLFGWQPMTAYAPQPMHPMTTQEEVDMLKQQSKLYQDALDDINKRIAELEAEKHK